jgi:hypothetical protein
MAIRLPKMTCPSFICLGDVPYVSYTARARERDRERERKRQRGQEEAKRKREMRICAVRRPERGNQNDLVITLLKNFVNMLNQTSP